MCRQKGKFGELLKRRWGRLRFQYSILCGVTSVKCFVQMVVGQPEKWPGGPAREITRRMRAALKPTTAVQMPAAGVKGRQPLKMGR